MAEKRKSDAETEPESGGGSGLPSFVAGLKPIMASFILSLVVGAVFQVLTNKETYEAVEKVQQSWQSTLEKASPFALARAYWDDLWEIHYNGWDATVPQKPTSIGIGVPVVKVEPTQECTNWLSSMQGACEGLGLSEKSVIACKELKAQSRRNFEASARCQAWNEYRLAERRMLDAISRSQRGSYTNSAPPPKLSHQIPVPALALVRTFLRLTEDGGWSYLWLTLQLAMGVPGFMLAHAYLVGGRFGPQYFPEHPIAKIIVVPIGVVVMASVLAFCLQQLMLGGLWALGWLAGLAGALCGALGVAGFCWWCTHEFAKHVITGQLDKRLLK